MTTVYPSTWPMWDHFAGVLPADLVQPMIDMIARAYQRSVSIPLFYPDPVHNPAICHAKLAAQIFTQLAASVNQPNDPRLHGALIAASRLWITKDMSHPLLARAMSKLHDALGDGLFEATIQAFCGYAKAARLGIGQFLPLLAYLLPRASERWIAQASERLLRQHGVTPWAAFVHQLTKHHQWLRRLRHLLMGSSVGLPNSPLVHAAYALASLYLPQVSKLSYMMPRNVRRHMEALTFQDRLMFAFGDISPQMSYPYRCKLLGVVPMRNIDDALSRWFENTENIGMKHPLSILLAHLMADEALSTSQNLPKTLVSLAKTMPLSVGFLYDLIWSSPKDEDLCRRIAYVLVNDPTGCIIGHGIMRNIFQPRVCFDTLSAFVQRLPNDALRAQTLQAVHTWQHAYLLFMQTHARAKQYVFTTLGQDLRIRNYTQVIKTIQTQAWQEGFAEAVYSVCGEHLPSSLFHSYVHDM